MDEVLSLENNDQGIHSSNQTEKQLKEYGDKVPADKKAPIETALTKLKDAYAAKNFADIDVAQEELQTAWTAASEDMYKGTQDPGAQGAANPGAGAAGGNAGNSGDTVTDVDFASASSFISLISSSVKPEEASIRSFCSLPVALSLADTCRIPLASMSKVTSI